MNLDSMPSPVSAISSSFRIVLLVALLVAFGNASACFTGEERGDGWTAEELVGKSESIVLAVLIGKEEAPAPFSGPTTFRLKTVEVLKGEDPEFVEFYSSSEDHHGEDFAGHTNDEFWAEDMGRSPFPCCICRPDHTFVEGETYLLFPDAFGAMKSAEIVSSTDDKWLQYVRESLKPD